MSIAELIQAVRLALSGESANTCGGLDGNHDDALTVDELVVGVRHALYGCMALAVPDAVFDANVFFGPARNVFTPAVVRQDLGGALSLSVEYDVAQAIQATGYFNADGRLRLEGNTIDADLARPFAGLGEFRVIDDVFFLQSGIQQQQDGDASGIRMSRSMRGTPSTWGGAYQVTLTRDGVDAVFPLILHVPPSGFGECEGPAGHDDAEPHLRSGPCLISPNGGFRFRTALPHDVETSEVVLFGLLETTEDTVTGHGTWGSRLSGQTLGTWTAVSHR